MAKTAKKSPFDRQLGETHVAWKFRVESMKADSRVKADPIVPKEAARHYDEQFVLHIETGTKAQAMRHRSISSLVRMHQTGRLDNSQYAAAISIARVAECIERTVSVRCASIAARVDCSHGRDPLVERLSQVRDEMTYTRWRRQIPLPRRMILDMVLVDRPLAVTARKYGMRWEPARTLFIDALDLWCELRERAAREIDGDDLIRAYARLAA